MTSRAQSAYEQIRQRIAMGELRTGANLSETMLAHDLRVSRTPIREAIRRLESEGLLEQRPKKGTYLHVPALREIRELFDLRILLEPLAVARAARRRDPGLILRLDELLRQMQDVVRQLRTTRSDVELAALSRRYRTCDCAFHATLAPESGNRRLCKIVNDIGILSLTIEQERNSPSCYESANREHEEIVTAIRLGESRRAVRAVRQHLRKGWRTARRCLASLKRQECAVS
jgi:DNA-binding GntR family transcriptional regulator